MTKRYIFPPTVGRFAVCDKRLQFLFGPLGGGKTTGTLMKLLKLAHAQKPNSNGRRKSRWAVVRNTRPQLRDSVLKTVFEWLPPNGRTIQWHDSNMDLKLELPLADGSLVECELLFRALDNENDARRLLSVEYTGGWMSEFREIPFSLMTDLLSRCGRYPPVNDGGADWYGVFGESNMCTKGSEWYNYLMVNRPPYCEVFIQPSGIGPDAENRQYLKPDYYEVLLSGKGKEWIKAHILSEFPDSLDGRAVWGGAYDFERHVSTDKLKLNGLAPIIIGVDQGRSPAAVVTQMVGQTLNVLFETYGENMGMDRFVTEKLRPLVAENFPQWPMIVAIDPAGCRKSEVNDDSPKDVLERNGFHVIPAPTNALDRRLNAVERLMLLANGIRFCQHGVPTLINAVASDYRFSVKRTGEIEDKPEKKHPVSDLADSLQYATLVAAGEYTGRINRLVNRKRAPQLPPPPPRGWT